MIHIAQYRCHREELVHDAARLSMCRSWHMPACVEKGALEHLLIDALTRCAACVRACMLACVTACLRICVRPSLRACLLAYVPARPHAGVRAYTRSGSAYALSLFMFMLFNLLYLFYVVLLCACSVIIDSIP